MSTFNDANSNVQSTSSQDLMSDSSFNPIVVSLIREHGLNSSVKKNYDAFMQLGIRQILTQVFSIDLNIKQVFPGGYDVVNVKVTFNNVSPRKPTRRTDQTSKPVFPHDAKKGMFTYQAPILCNIKVELKGHKEGISEPFYRSDIYQDILVAEIPIPTGSAYCNLHGFTKTELIAQHEDPTDCFGYFVVGGNLWVVLPLETKPFNFPSIYRNEGQTKDEKCRLEIISKPGDGYENSCQTIIIYKVKGGIIVRVPSYKEIRNIEIPFYVLLRLLGAMNDEEIISTILGCQDFDILDDQQQSMFTILVQAIGMSNEFFPGAQDIKDNVRLRDLVYDCLVKHEIATTPTESKMSDIKAKLVQTFMDGLDAVVLPHVGIGRHARRDKFKHFCRLIRYTLLVYLGEIPESSRDNFMNKRSKLAGESMGSTSKNILNKTLIKNIVKKIHDIIPYNDISLINTRNLIEGSPASDFASRLARAIRSGEDHIGVGSSGDTVNKNFRTNRVEFKNKMNVPVTSSSMTTRAVFKGGDRSHEMRAIHPSHPGNSCLYQSPDTGDKVGLPKLKPPASIISETDDSERLKDILANDDLVISSRMMHHTKIYKTTVVMVNGFIVGYTNKAYTLLVKYRELRRGWDVNTLTRLPSDFQYSIGKHTSIYWDMDRDELNFWVDSGRILQPLLVVRNNTDYDPIGQHLIGSKFDEMSLDGFKQQILMTKEILDQVELRQIQASHLISEGIIDLVGPDELYYSRLCPTLAVLINNASNPLERYDYYQIPSTRYGLPVLHCPLVNYNNAARIVFSSNQSRSANSVPSLAYPFDYTKKKYVVHTIMMPLVTTLATQIIMPIGYTCYMGTASIATNQEDSIEFNRDAAQLGAFATDQITTLSKKYKRSEMPIQPTTDIIGRNTRNFSKLDDRGFVKKYSEVNSGDVLICVGEPNKTTGKQDVDGSLIHENKTKAIVTTVIEHITEGNKKVKFVSKIVLVDENPIIEGDKFSSRHGQKGVVSCVVRKTDMFNTHTGIIPTLVISNHAHPTRMDPGQLIEQLLSDYCLHNGKLFDATAHTTIDEDMILRYLERVLFNKYGHYKTFNPHTGLQCYNDFCVQPCTYYRLQKFAANECNISTDKVHKSSMTKQPVSGFRNGGGGKISELAAICVAAQGASTYQYTKYRFDCDGVTLPMCSTCGRDSVYNFETGNSYCKHCNEQMVQSKIVNVPTGNITKVIFQLFKSAGIDVQCNFG